MSRWAVQEYTHCDGWVNNWSEEDGAATEFESEDRASAELGWFLQEMQDAYEKGLVHDVPSKESFKIVEVK